MMLKTHGDQNRRKDRLFCPDPNHKNQRFVVNFRAEERGSTRFLVFLD